MLGQWCLVVDSDFEVLDDSVVDVEGAGVVVVELVAAEAPEMPAAAPPLTRAPATIVAPSILDIRIISSLSLDGHGVCDPSWAARLWVSLQMCRNTVGGGSVLAMAPLTDLELPRFDYLDPTLRGERFHEATAGPRSRVARAESHDYIVLNRSSRVTMPSKAGLA